MPVGDPKVSVVMPEIGAGRWEHDKPVSSSAMGEWDEELQQALAEKDSLLVASVDVLSKRLKEAERRNQELETLITNKDERIMRLVDIIIHKMGGSDGKGPTASSGGCSSEEEQAAAEGAPNSQGTETGG